MALFIATPASGGPATPGPPADSESVAASRATPAEPEIVVYGRRSTDRYRIAPELRAPAPSLSGDWRKTAALDRACENVGPRGCGTPLVPIVTVGGDGSVQVGQPE